MFLLKNFCEKTEFIRLKPCDIVHKWSDDGYVFRKTKLLCTPSEKIMGISQKAYMFYAK